MCKKQKTPKQVLRHVKQLLEAYIKNRRDNWRTRNLKQQILNELKLKYEYGLTESEYQQLNSYHEIKEFIKKHADKILSYYYSKHQDKV